MGRYGAAGAAGGSGDHGWTISWHEELLKEKDELLKKKDAKKKARRSAGTVGINAHGPMGVSRLAVADFCSGDSSI